MSEIIPHTDFVQPELALPGQLELGASFDVPKLNKYDQPEPLPKFWVVVDRFVSLYDQAIDDEHFDHELSLDTYLQAHHLCMSWAQLECTAFPHYTFRHVAAVIATLSPRMEWLDNQRKALNYLETGKFKGLGRAQRDLDRLEAGEDPDDVINDPTKNNPKIRAFYANISDPHAADSVTIDTHMYNIAKNNPTYMGYGKIQQFPKEHYGHIADAVKVAAELVGVGNNQMQSIVWYYWKRINGIADNSVNPNQGVFDLGDGKGIKEIFVR